MSQQTDEQLSVQAQQIKNETTKKANTANRVGTHLQNINDSKVNNEDLFGGTTGQVLKKQSNDDGDYDWEDEAGGGGSQDLQSVLDQGSAALLTDDVTITDDQTHDVSFGTNSGDALNTFQVAAENAHIVGITDTFLNFGGAGTGIGMSAAAMVVTDNTNSKGLEYDADYSANYTNRSLVDKEYVDNAAGGGGTVTSVAGTTNRITSTGGATPVIDISAAYDAAITSAIDAKVIDSIADSDTTHAPSRNSVFDALALKAPLASPTFTGTPAAPTAAQDNNSSQIATTAYVDAAVVGADLYLYSTQF